MKRCSNCNHEKPDEAFAWKNKARKTRSHQCKDCHANYSKKHYQQNKQYYIDKSHKRKSEIRAWYNEYKRTLTCTKCGEDHPACLEFHHTDSKQKDREVARLVLWGSINRIKKEIEKCVVLCSNCHRKFHYLED